MKKQGPTIYKNGEPYEVRLTLKGRLYAIWLAIYHGIRRYKPIKVFSIHFGSGWWCGKHLWFFKTSFAVIPMSFHVKYTDMPSEWYDMVDQEIYSWKFYDRLGDYPGGGSNLSRA